MAEETAAGGAVAGTAAPAVAAEPAAASTPAPQPAGGGQTTAAAPQGGGESASVPVARFNQVRDREKAARRELEDLRRSLASPKADPEARAKEFEDNPLGYVDRRMDETRHEQREFQARQYLYTQPEASSDPEFEDNMATVRSHFPGLDRMDPVEAAFATVNLYRQFMAGYQKSQEKEAAAAGGTRQGGNGGTPPPATRLDKAALQVGGGAGAGGGGAKKTWTRRDIRMAGTAGGMTLEEFRKNKDDIYAAIAEGRVTD